jgi:hypothetical protein
MVMLKKTKGLTWPFWALALATTLVYMAGLAALQYSCSYIPTVQATPGIFGRSAFGEFVCLQQRLYTLYRCAEPACNTFQYGGKLTAVFALV